MTVRAGLQRWLGDLIDVRAVEATSSDSTLRVEVTYIVRRTQESRVAVFNRSTT
jgi:uncharacterized protein